MKICTPNIALDIKNLTQHDLKVLEKMDIGVWVSWLNPMFDGINRVHFRCVRLWQAGLIDWGIPEGSSGEVDAYYKVMVRRKLVEGTTQ
ncbi:hypothetical protein ABW06_24765 [Pluralibacter gergoviae]|uniref:Uncharacterized protein n=1 Tax=Pluralibacter gergoviae TaxID=61647 RepID=A0A0J5NIE5_PLUGE|nr:hypothetical protein [Pluralibacter gergoviae]KMK08157.1 hypothetical protein ABW06_24765 [Pluralibacter gergoviae]